MKHFDERYTVNLRIGKLEMSAVRPCQMEITPRTASGILRELVYVIGAGQTVLPTVDKVTELPLSSFISFICTETDGDSPVEIDTAQAAITSFLSPMGLIGVDFISEHGESGPVSA